ncbi:aspartate/glutamate racemase family protein, partial [Endozoicomonas sp.]|uniref:aspartate/glutamate racemase family protein n=1 Tax=Endozoicomonas sp. TaxID=1892382 RepID=UPI00383BCF55
ATIAADIYKKRIQKINGQCLVPDDLGQQQVMTAIYDIKADRLEQGAQGMEAIFNTLIDAGAEAVILGCTEIPIGLAVTAREQPQRCIDATALLARACVDWYYSDYDHSGHHDPYQAIAA